ncbi:hypothetical protein Vafri_17946 [Volvox africanus]|uniref:Uncharacterized protein n=1 Tax=Volvox africanus TaxID=51714 RepID=A0A8J4F869_9CHLO|nr:hypothetical protein Vafri_17946 [Volvox africanus]
MESCTTISDSLNAARRFRMMQSLAAGGGGGGGGGGSGCAGATFAPIMGGATSTTQRLSRLGISSMGELAPLTSVPLTSAPLAAHCSSDWVCALLTEGGGGGGGCGAASGTNEVISIGKEPAASASASAKTVATATAIARLTNCLATLSGPDGGCSAPSGIYAVPMAITTVAPDTPAAAAAPAPTSSAGTASTALAAEGVVAVQQQQNNISIISGDGRGGSGLPGVLRNWFVDILGQQSSILTLSRAPSNSTKHKARGSVHHQLRSVYTPVPASSDADADVAIAAGGDAGGGGGRGVRAVAAGGGGGGGAGIVSTSNVSIGLGGSVALTPWAAAPVKLNSTFYSDDGFGDPEAGPGSQCWTVRQVLSYLKARPGMYITHLIMVCMLDDDLTVGPKAEFCLVQLYRTTYQQKNRFRFDRVQQ